MWPGVRRGVAPWACPCLLQLEDDGVREERVSLQINTLSVPVLLAGVAAELPGLYTLKTGTVLKGRCSTWDFLGLFGCSNTDTGGWYHWLSCWGNAHCRLPWLRSCPLCLLLQVLSLLSRTQCSHVYLRRVSRTTTDKYLTG